MQTAHPTVSYPAFGTAAQNEPSAETMTAMLLEVRRKPALLKGLAIVATWARNAYENDDTHAEDEDAGCIALELLETLTGR